MSDVNKESTGCSTAPQVQQAFGRAAQQQQHVSQPSSGTGWAHAHATLPPSSSTGQQGGGASLSDTLPPLAFGEPVGTQGWTVQQHGLPSMTAAMVDQASASVYARAPQDLRPQHPQQQQHPQQPQHADTPRMMHEAVDSAASSSSQQQQQQQQQQQHILAETGLPRFDPMMFSQFHAMQQPQQQQSQQQQQPQPQQQQMMMQQLASQLPGTHSQAALQQHLHRQMHQLNQVILADPTLQPDISVTAPSSTAAAAGQLTRIPTTRGVYDDVASHQLPKQHQQQQQQQQQRQQPQVEQQSQQSQQRVATSQTSSTPYFVNTLPPPSTATASTDANMQIQAAQAGPTVLSPHTTAPVPTTSTATTSTSSASFRTGFHRQRQRSEPDVVTRVCPVEGCEESFKLLKHLKQHINSDHADSAKSLLSEIKPAAKKQRCQFCDSAYAFKSGLYRHIREVHPERAAEVIPKKHEARFSCFFCDTPPFQSVTKFLRHTKEAHPAQYEDTIDYTVRYFPSMMAFDEWLKGEQDSTYTEYLLRYNHSTDAVQSWSNDERVHVVRRLYRVCARNRAPPPGMRLKRPNRRKPHKGVGMCLARMWIDVAKEGRVRVRFLRNHSHKCTPEHTAIPRAMREFIASQIVANVPSVKVLSNVQTAFQGQERAKLITVQDINNIARSCVRAQLNTTETEHLIQQLDELEKQGPSPLLALKLPGEPAFRMLPHGHESAAANVGQDDFVLVLQTQAQKKLMQECGLRGVCLTATTQANRYHYPLLTLLGESPAGSAVALGHCITNKETTHITRLLLSSTTLPLDVRPRTFLTEEDEIDTIEFSVARQLWGTDIKRLYCTWAMGHNWRSKVVTKASTPSAGKKAFKALVHVIRASTPDEFEARWEGFCRLWKPTEPSLVAFAREYFYERRRLWSQAFREKSDPSTDNLVGEFHATLHSVSPGHLGSVSVDELLRLLIKVDARQKEEALRVSQKGRAVVVERKARAAIEQAKAFNQANIHESAPALFKVTSELDDEVVHTVTRASIPNCKLCSARPCIHCYECTCFEFAVSNTDVCVHTGAVYAHLKNNASQQKPRRRRAKAPSSSSAAPQQQPATSAADDSAAAASTSAGAPDTAATQACDAPASSSPAVRSPPVAAPVVTSAGGAATPSGTTTAAAAAAAAGTAAPEASPTRALPVLAQEASLRQQEQQEQIQQQHLQPPHPQPQPQPQPLPEREGGGSPPQKRAHMGDESKQPAAGLEALGDPTSSTLVDATDAPGTSATRPSNPSVSTTQQRPASTPQVPGSLSQPGSSQ